MEGGQVHLLNSAGKIFKNIISAAEQIYKNSKARVPKIPRRAILQAGATLDFIKYKI